MSDVEKKLESETYLLLHEHGLDDWTVKFNRKKTVSAEAWYEEKTIYYSRVFFPFMEGNPKAVKNIVTHEVAHAVCGFEAEHGEEWLKQCLDMGGNGQVYSDVPIERIARYRMVCLQGCTIYQHRKSDARKWICAEHEIPLVLQQNPLREVS